MIITDKDLGEIRLVQNRRAKKIIVRYRNGIFLLTHPTSVNLLYIKSVIEEIKPRLLRLIENKPQKLLLAPDSDFKTFSFKLELVENFVNNNFCIKLKDGILSILYPLYTKFDDNETQKVLKEQIERVFHYESNRLFPRRVKVLAKKYKFEYNRVKINKSCGRWGSCSSKKDINLSYYLMLLPEYLIDFVILHELCHTKEMNHGNNFWLLLDEVTNGKAKELTKELNAFKTNW